MESLLKKLSDRIYRINRFIKPNPDEPEPNSKSEARNSKQILMFKRIMIKTGLAAI